MRSLLFLLAIFATTALANDEYDHAMEVAKADHKFEVKRCYKRPMAEQAPCLKEANRNYAEATSGLRRWHLGTAKREFEKNAQGK